LRTDENDTDCVAVSPSKSTLQCSTASSYKMTPSHTFLENSTAEAVIQVDESWFLGVSSRSTQPSWSNVALWCCTLKMFGLPSYYSQLLAKPLLFQVLSPECNFLVAPILAMSRHEGWFSKQKIYWDILFCVSISRRSHWCWLCKNSSRIQVIARFTAHHQDSMRHWLVHIFNLPVNVLEHELQQIFGDQTLSW